VKDLLLRGAARVALARPLVSMLGAKRRTSIDPQVAAVLELQRLLRLPRLETMPPARARQFAVDGLSPLDVAPRSMAEVVDAGPLRIYVPREAGRDWIVYFHGGGGVIGSIASCEPVTRYLAARTGATVAAVEYRLGPEHPHPAAIDDAVAAFTAVAARAGRGARIAVAGDSFGGFLATHVAARARDRRPHLQVLIYPLLDLTMSSPSIETFADGYLLTRSMMAWFRSNYLGGYPDARGASPAFWPSLAGAVPALVTTAGFDPLVDEGDAFAARLTAAGVPVRHRRYPTLVHGYLSLAGAVHAARAALDELCRDITDLLG
jgi:acetyl esterase